MSKTKRYLSILLCLVLLCTTLIPMYAFAADDTLQILCDGVVAVSYTHLMVGALCAQALRCGEQRGAGGVPRAAHNGI